MDLILDSLKVMAFGMLGIFFVMGLIILSTVILNAFGKNKVEEPEEDSDE